MRHIFDDMDDNDDEEVIDTTGNLPPMVGIYPDHPTGPAGLAAEQGALGDADACGLSGGQAD